MLQMFAHWAISRLQNLCGAYRTIPNTRSLALVWHAHDQGINHSLLARRQNVTPKHLMEMEHGWNIGNPLGMMG